MVTARLERKKDLGLYINSAHPSRRINHNEVSAADYAKPLDLEFKNPSQLERFVLMELATSQSDSCEKFLHVESRIRLQDERRMWDFNSQYRWGCLGGTERQNPC